MRIAHIALLLIAFFNLHAAADFEYWYDLEARALIVGKLNINTRFSYRFNEKASQFYYFYQELRFAWHVKPTLSVVPGFRQVYQLVENQWKPYYEPTFDFNKWGKFYGIEWLFRNRFIYDNPTHLWRIRDRITLIFPKLPHLLLRPVFYEETFFALFTQFVQYRHYFGVQYGEDKFKGRLGYLLRYTKSGTVWSQQNILYTELYVEF